MGEYGILDLSSTQKWNDYLQRLPIEQQDIYYIPEYYQLYEELGDGRARCFVFEDGGDIALYPFLINSVNDLGYVLDKEYFDIQGSYGYNGVVSNSNSLKFRTSFHNEFKFFCKDNNIIAEFIRFHPMLQNVDFHKDFISIYRDRNTVSLDLTQTYDFIWETSYSSKNRNMINKANRSQFTVNISENPSFEKILTFVNIYYETMKSVNAEKYYFFNEKYFISMFRNLNSNAVLIDAINNKNEIECTAIIFIYGIFAHYHLSGRKEGSDNSVNNFLLDEAVKYAISKGVKKFHFGGGKNSSTEDQLLKFKSNFSNERSDFYIGKNIYNQDVYNKVINQWERKFPEKAEKYRNLILKYRY